MLETLAPSLTLDERVYGELRRAIVSSALKPGQELIVTGVAEQLGVSRIPVMHACQRLVGEGFLVSNPRKSFVVAPMTESRVTERYAVLTALECVAVEGAASTATDAQGQEWRQLMDDARAFRLQHGATESNTSDYQFHRAVWDAAGMPYLSHLLRVVFEHLEPARSLARSRNDPNQSAGEHQRLLDALTQHDAAAAQDAVRVHRQHGLERSIAALKARAQ